MCGRTYIIILFPILIRKLEYRTMLFKVPIQFANTSSPQIYIHYNWLFLHTILRLLLILCIFLPASNPQLSPSTSFLRVHVLSLLNYQIN